MSNNKQSSSIDWILDWIEDVDLTPELWEKIKKQAKAMHKQEIEDAELRGKEIIIIKHTEHSTPIELPSDDEILKRYIFYIDTEIQLGFLEESQGARLKWYYTKYFSNKIQGGEQ